MQQKQEQQNKIRLSISTTLVNKLQGRFVVWFVVACV